MAGRRKSVLPLFLCFTVLPESLVLCDEQSTMARLAGNSCTARLYSIVVGHYYYYCVDLGMRLLDWRRSGKTNRNHALYLIPP